MTDNLLFDSRDLDEFATKATHDRSGQFIAVTNFK